MRPSLFKRLLSHFIPFTKKVNSEYSGQLEITVVNGRKVLDTKNANYSYGSVHRIFHFGLSQFDFSTINSILLLGLGGGTILKILREDLNYQGNITAVEKDAVIVKVANEEFGIREDQKTRIICDDALKYISKNNGTYDLTIVDIFIDNTVPKPFLEIPFWENVTKRTNSYFLFNSINDTTKTLNSLKKWFNKQNISTESFEKVENSNTLIKGKLPLRPPIL
jgi:spermidine synthase